MFTLLVQRQVESGSAGIAELLRNGAVVVALQAEDRDTVINALVDMVKDHPAVIDVEQARRDVFERESLMSTGVGERLALPHARTTAVSGAVAAFATLARPVDFNAIDNEPVDTVFLFLGPPTAQAEFIRILSRISRLMNSKDVRAMLLAAGRDSQVLSVFEEAEGELLDR